MVAKTKPKTKTAQSATLWRDIVTGLTREDPTTLIPNALNYRMHTDRQRVVLLSAIDELGFLHPVIVNDRSGKLLDGHERVAAAIATSQPAIPVIHVDLPPEREAYALSIIDPISAMVELENEQMRETLAQIDTDSEALQLFLDDQAARAGLLAQLDPETEWEGMPEFDQQNKDALQKVIISFASREDIAAFAKLTGLSISDRTRGVWFPPHESINYQDRAFVDEES